MSFKMKGFSGFKLKTKPKQGEKKVGSSREELRRNKKKLSDEEKQRNIDSQKLHEFLLKYQEYKRKSNWA